MTVAAERRHLGPSAPAFWLWPDALSWSPAHPRPLLAPGPDHSQSNSSQMSLPDSSSSWRPQTLNSAKNDCCPHSQQQQPGWGGGLCLCPMLSAPLPCPHWQGPDCSCSEAPGLGRENP